MSSFSAPTKNTFIHFDDSIERWKPRSRSAPPAFFSSSWDQHNNLSLIHI